MEVILLERIKKLGLLGERVKVKAGYGRNFLIPKGKAVYATAENLKKFEARRAELEKVEADALQAAKVKQEALSTLAQVTITAKAGEEGKLFGSINARDVAEAIEAAGISLDKVDIHLSTDSIRQLGEYEAHIELHADVTARIKIIVAPDA